MYNFFFLMFHFKSTNALVYNYIAKFNCQIGGNLLFLALFKFNNKQLYINDGKLDA